MINLHSNHKSLKCLIELNVADTCALHILWQLLRLAWHVHNWSSNEHLPLTPLTSVSTPSLLNAGFGIEQAPMRNVEDQIYIDNLDRDWKCIECMQCCSLSLGCLCRSWNGIPHPSFNFTTPNRWCTRRSARKLGNLRFLAPKNVARRAH